MKKIKVIRAVMIALTIGILTTSGYYLHLFDRLENIVYDQRVRFFREKTELSEKIAVILIDDSSLKALDPLVGRWPWPRSLYYDLLDFLKIGGAKAVVLDLLFTENERAENERVEGAGWNDSILVNATRESANVYHAMRLFEDREDEFNKKLLNNPLPHDFVTKFALKNVKKIALENTRNNIYYLPFPELYKASNGVGVVEFTPDNDGVYRKTSLIRQYQDYFFPVLSIAPLIKDLSVQSIIGEKERLTFITEEEKIVIPEVEDGKYLINYYGLFRPYSISGIFASKQMMLNGDVENLPINPSEFKDKIVFIGASAVGLEDLKSTPMSSGMPGVEIHSTIISNLIKRDFLRVKKSEVTLFYIFLISTAICFMVIFIPTPAARALCPFIFFLTLLFWWIYQFKNNIVYQIIPPSISGLASLIASFAYLGFTEGKDKRKIRKMFSQCVSPTVMNEAMKKYNGVLKAAVGAKKNITILFSDIRGFTNISEKLTPEEVVDFLNQYLSVMTDVIFQHNGTVDKFIGDAILAFWGAPLKIDTHALKAVDTAVDMARALDNLNQIFKTKGILTLNIGIGINTGEVIVGYIGSEKKLEYTVIGDNVNLASRLEGLTKAYKVRAILTESAYNELGGKAPCRLIDMVRVKGKERPVKIYGILCKSSDSVEVLREKKVIEKISMDAFSAYQNRKWKQAIEFYNELLSINPGDEISKNFIGLCENYLINEPGESWEGISTFTTK